MKKLIIFLVAAIMATLLIVPASAAQTATVTIRSNASSVYAGATVTFTVKVTGVSAAKSIGIIPSYDTNTFELVSGQWLVTGSAMSDFSGGVASIAYASSRAFNENVFKFTLKVKSNAKLNTYTVNATVSIKNGNETVNCNVSGGKVAVTCNHSYSGYSNLNGTQHQRTCSKCGAVDKKNHSFSNACDTRCNDCGYTRTITHNYKTTWSSDGKQHWHECSVCKAKKDAANHVPGPAATETTEQKCTICNRVLAGKTDHVHTFGEEWKNDESGHWHICSSCGSKSNVEAHIYDNACDTDCNTCSYKREITHSYGTEFKSDGENHWYECGVCGTAAEKVAHTYDNDCDADCNDCGHERVVEHTYDDGTVKVEPTENLVGEKEYICTKCGEKKTVELEYHKVEIEKTAKEKAPVTLTVIASVVCLIVGIGIGCGVMTFVGKKKSK